MQENVNDMQLEQTRLIVRLSRTALAFAVVDRSTEKQLLFEPYTVRSGISMAANLREAFKTSTLLMRGYKKVNLLIDAPVMLLPIDVFHEEEVEELYRHTFVLGDGDTLRHQVLNELNAVAVFPVSKDLQLVLTDHFADVRITPLMRSVWTHLHRRSFTGIGRKLYAYFHGKRLEVFAFEKNRFRFCNVFEAGNSRDALYFVLYVWKQLGMNALSDELHLVGEIPEQDWLKAAFQKFVKRTYVINPSADFHRAPITTIPHLPYDLMTFFLKDTHEGEK